MSEFALDRTQRLLGKDGMERLKQSHVAVFGIGGVGGYAVEALVRSGIGALTLVDHDRVEPSNLNRQIIALHSTLGEFKVDAAAARVADIAPNCHVSTYRCFSLKNMCKLSIFSDMILLSMPLTASKARFC